MYKLLHVDDEPDDHYLLEWNLNKLSGGLSIIAVTSVDEAFIKLKEENFDCVISDYQMPGKDGLAFLSEYKEGGFQMPFIFLTGQGSETIAANALRSGASDYFTKERSIAHYERILASIKRNINAYLQNEKLGETREHLNILFDNASDAILLNDERGNILKANKQACTIYGYNYETLMDMHVLEIDTRFTSMKDIETLVSSLKPGEPESIETLHKRSDGSVFPAEITINRVTIQNQKCVIAVIRDISDRKRLENLQADIINLFKISSIKNKEDVMRSFLEAGMKNTGSRAGTFSLGLHQELVMSREQQSDSVQIGDLMQFSKPVTIQNPRPEKQQKTLTVNIYSNSHILGEMSVTGKETEYDSFDEEALNQLSLAAWEIIKNKRTEEALTRSEQNIQNFIHDAPFGMYRSTLDGKIIMANPALAKIFGYKSTDDIYKLKLDNDLSFGNNLTREEFIKNLQENGQIEDAQFEYLRVDGSKIVVRENAQAVYDRDGEFIYIEGIIEDITEKTIFEREIAQAEKLQAVGQLAAGIAHEINTPMQYISDNLKYVSSSIDHFTSLIALSEKLVSDKTDQDDKVISGQVQKVLAEIKRKSIAEELKYALEDATDGVGVVTDIVHSMRVFSHPGSEGKQDVDLNELVQSTVNISKNEWKYVSELDLDLAPTPVNVNCFAREINQVLLNMIINAKHAIEKNIEDKQIERGLITISTKTQNEYAVVRIQDNGCGIPKNIQPRVFEPFFTTKQVGKGTGQGLAISYNIIVNKHHGKVHLKSTPQQGTTFMIRLPLKSDTDDEEIIG